MISKLCLTISVLVIIAAAQQQVRAEIFNFDDEYYVGSSHSSTYQSIFGTTVGYGTAGIYQETRTPAGGGVIVNKLSTGSSVPGEYVENTTVNATQYLSLTGWGQSLNNGQQVVNVYNVGNPTNGPIYLQYRVGTTSGSGAGGTLTPFTFNSFDLRGSSTSANLSFTLEGFLGGNLVDSAILTVTGNTFSTFTENWQNIDTVEIVSTTSLPVNWGSGTLYMDNVKIDDPKTVPEPSTLALMCIGAIGILVFARRRRADFRPQPKSANSNRPALPEKVGLFLLMPFELRTLCRGITLLRSANRFIQLPKQVIDIKRF